LILRQRKAAKCSREKRERNSLFPLLAGGMNVQAPFPSPGGRDEREGGLFVRISGNNTDYLEARKR